MTNRAEVEILVLSAVITGLVIFLDIFVLSNTASLAPEAGDHLYRAGESFNDGLVAGFILLVIGTPPAFLYLLSGR